MGTLLNDEMRQALQEKRGQPLAVFDPDTNTSYVLIRQDLYERVRPFVEQTDSGSPATAAIEVPPGTQRSRDAFRNDLPKYLDDRKLQGRWVLYRQGEFCRFARTEQELVRECLARSWAPTEYYLGKVSPCELAEVEDIDPSLFEFEEASNDA